MTARPAEFSLTLQQLDEIRRALRDRIHEGLQEDGRSIACLPAFLPAPPPALEGEAVVVDLGGTNLRAARVQLSSDGAFRFTGGPLKRELSGMRGDSPRSREAFFDDQAALVAALEGDWPVPLGYVFSFPSEVFRDRDAQLLRWTKDFNVPGVIGTRVGAALGEALSRHACEPRSITVMNDTVSALLGGVHRLALPAPNVIGLIAGTGTNMAAYYNPKLAQKLARQAVDGWTAINLESGNFDPPHLTEYDGIVDRQSSNPGRQRFEKAISGHYLPLIYGQVTGVRALKSSAELVELCAQGGEPGDLARALLSRSADLVAAGLAAVIDDRPAGPVGVLAEGSLFWGDPEYANRVRRRLSELCAERAVEITPLEDVNFVGAAVAALIP